MKSRAFAAMIAVLLVVGVSLPALAQDNTQSQTSTQVSSSSPDQSQPASTTANDSAPRSAVGKRTGGAVRNECDWNR